MDIALPPCPRTVQKTLLSIGLLLLDRIQLTALGCFTDSLAALGEDCRLALMTPTGQTATTDQGLEIAVSELPLWPEGFDYIVVMGGLPGKLWRWSNTISRYLRTADRLDLTLVGLGNGTETLARLGMLNGHRACATSRDLSTLSAAYPDVHFESGHLIIEDRKRITSLDGTAAADLAGLLTTRHIGRRRADIATAGLHRATLRPPDASPPIGQQAYRAGHPKIAKMLDLMIASISDPKPVQHIADHLLVSRRQLDRLCLEETGETVRALYFRLRKEEAARLIVAERRSLSEAAWRTGFSDPAHLSRSLDQSVHQLRNGSLP